MHCIANKANDVPTALQAVTYRFSVEKREGHAGCRRSGFVRNTAACKKEDRKEMSCKAYVLSKGMPAQHASAGMSEGKGIEVGMLTARISIWSGGRTLHAA